MDSNAKAATAPPRHEHRRPRPALPLVDWGAYTDAEAHWHHGSSATERSSSRLGRSTWHFRRQGQADMDAPPVEVPLSICVFDKRKSAVDEEVGNASMSSCDTDDTDDQSGHGHLPTPANGSVESLLPYVQTAMTLNAPLPSKDGDPVASTMQHHHHHHGSKSRPQPLTRRSHSSPGHGGGWFDGMTRGLFWLAFMKPAAPSLIAPSHSAPAIHETDLGGSGECEEDVHHPYDTPCHDASNASDTSLPLMELHRL